MNRLPLNEAISYFSPKLSRGDNNPFAILETSDLNDPSPSPDDRDCLSKFPIQKRKMSQSPTSPPSNTFPEDTDLMDFTTLIQESIKEISIENPCTEI
jgi:hypothetical protein